MPLQIWSGKFILCHQWPAKSMIIQNGMDKWQGWYAWKHKDMLIRLISVLCKICIVWRKKVITHKTIANLDSHLPGYTQVFIPSLNVYRYPRYVSVLPVPFYDFSGLCPFSFWHVLYLQQVSLTFKQKNSFLLTRLKKSCNIQRGMVRW